MTLGTLENMENEEEFDDDVGDFLEISEEPVIKDKQK